jgi:hypothetical protein
VLKEVDDDQTAWKVRNVLLPAIEADKLSLASAVRPTVLPEPAEDKKDCLSKGGKFLGWLRKQGVDQSQTGKPEWGPPFRIYTAVGRAPRPHALGTYEPRTGHWTFGEEGLVSVGLTVEAARRAMA